MNMNIIIPIPGGRSFTYENMIVRKLLQPLLCQTFSDKIETIQGLSIRVTNIAFSLIISNMFQNFITTDQFLDYSLNLSNICGN